MIRLSLHPASQLGLTAALLVAVTHRDGVVLFLSSAVIGLAASRWGGRRWWLLLRRSRWLLISMLAIFLLLTPGTPVPWLPAISREGLLQGTEHAARLLTALGLLAIVLNRLGPMPLIAALHGLARPLSWFGLDRDRLAVRLALTLEAVDDGGLTAASAGDVVRLPRQRLTASDGVATGLAVILLLVAVLP